MKKIAILSLTFLLAMAVLPSMGQVNEMKSVKKAPRKLEGTMVSTISKNAFVVDFGNIPDVAWMREVNFDVASFTKDGMKMKAFYDWGGVLVGTTIQKTFTDLPAKGQKEIKARYKDYAIGPVIFYDDNQANETEMVLYTLQFEDADNYFVELTNGPKKIVVRVDPDGAVAFFKQL